VQLTPRYEGPAILTIDGPSGEIGVPLARQRRRMETMLAELTDEQWATGSRCDGWAVRDVVAHLIGVNSFWHVSLVSGLRGAPTRFVAGFDPAASPPQMVAAMGPLSGAQLLEQFIATNDALLGASDALDDDGWRATAEAPPGHVSIRVMAQHALWDSWVHERDIAIPLGLACAVEPDEVGACLQYAAAISPALGLGLGHVTAGSYAVSAREPEVRFVLDVGVSVSLAADASAADDVPCLCGDAVELIEALSLRAPMPASTPPQWTALVNGLQAAFDAPPDPS
jgi:uncharacterized protein (TIGR03083 family)